MIAFAIHGACDVYGESIAFQSRTSSTRLAITHAAQSTPIPNANREAWRSVTPSPSPADMRRPASRVP